MPSKSVPIPSSNGAKHVVGIDIFHQLHCLDSLRKRLRPDRYPNPDWPMHGHTLGHPDHCVESLRLYLICNADISPVSWVWKDGDGKQEGKYVTSTTKHICRNWDRIWEWGLSHRRVHDLDKRIDLGLSEWTWNCDTDILSFYSRADVAPAALVFKTQT